jgi:hypothetical protein
MWLDSGLDSALADHYALLWPLLEKTHEVDSVSEANQRKTNPAIAFSVGRC